MKPFIALHGIVHLRWRCLPWPWSQIDEYMNMCLWWYYVKLMPTFLFELWFRLYGYCVSMCISTLSWSICACIDDLKMVNNPLPMYPYVNAWIAEVRSLKCNIRFICLLCYCVLCGLCLKVYYGLRGWMPQYFF